MHATCSIGGTRAVFAATALVCVWFLPVGCRSSEIAARVVRVDAPANGLSVRVVDLQPDRLTVEPSESWIRVQQKGTPTPRAELRPNDEFTVFRPNAREEWRLVGIEQRHAVFDVVRMSGDVWVFPIGLIINREDERVVFCGSETGAR
jgi:membrane-associated protease RseP (regulator of RpoE activity)